ncbi:hypothetical protein C8R44DRAFT_881220 [Mycena epipterygia]|nr:hypothetical protein C8R44DRAFT_881220 [Mycena epipterygia]
MPAVNVLPALSPEDPLFGLIYYVLGGWLIGSSLVLLLEGILISQVYNYYSWYSEDSIALKCAVVVLFLLTILKSIQSFAITWINSVLYMRDPAGTVSLKKEWYQVVNIPLGAVITVYVQSYYCYRLYMEIEREVVAYYTTPLVMLMLLGLLSAIITAYVIAKRGKSSHWFAVHVSCTLATDVLITGTSTFSLIKARQEVLSRTRKLLSNLIKVSCQTALPATTATLIEVICSRIGGPELKPQATNSIILILLNMTPIIYANCMLYILNSRRSLQDADASTVLSNSEPNLNPPGDTLSRIQWRPGRPVELSSLGGAQLHTQVDTEDTSDGLELDSKMRRDRMV